MYGIELDRAGLDWNEKNRLKEKGEKQESNCLRTTKLKIPRRNEAHQNQSWKTTRGLPPPPQKISKYPTTSLSNLIMLVSVVGPCNHFFFFGVKPIPRPNSGNPKNLDISDTREGGPQIVPQEKTERQWGRTRYLTL